MLWQTSDLEADRLVCTEACVVLTSTGPCHICHLKLNDFLLLFPTSDHCSRHVGGQGENKRTLILSDPAKKLYKGYSVGLLSSSMHGKYNVF